MKRSFLILFLSIPLLIFSQSETDKILTQKIPSLLAKDTTEDYLHAKRVLLELEEKHGDLPENKFHLLSYSFKYGDLDFFKKEIIKLIEIYGLDLILLNKSLNYYESLTSGTLSDWFRNVYPESRAKWLKNNFEKLPYIKELNDFYIKDQALASLVSELQMKNFDDDTSEALGEVFFETSEKNFADLLFLYKTLGAYPSAKTFSLPQTSFFLVETHLLKNPNASKEYLDEIFPFYKNAYLRGEIDYLVFKNYDSQLLISSGKQYFGTLNKEEVPPSYLNEDGEIPVLDEANLIKRRAELGWK